jgi:hypothetical protein
MQLKASRVIGCIMHGTECASILEPPLVIMGVDHQPSQYAKIAVNSLINNKLPHWNRKGGFLI